MNGKQHKLIGIGAGVLGASILYKTNQDPTVVVTVVGSAVGSMLPDMDHDMTKLGRKRKVITNISGKALSIIIILAVIASMILIGALVLGGIDYGFDLTTLCIVLGGAVFMLILKKVIGNSKTFRWAIKHRGFMHTLCIPAVLVSATFITPLPLFYDFILGLAIGYCSHLFADMLTVEGCPILFPLSRSNIHILSLRTKNKSCTVAAIMVFIACIVASYFLGGIG